MLDRLKSLLGGLQTGSSITSLGLSEPGLDQDVSRQNQHREPLPPASPQAVPSGSRATGITFPVDDVVAAPDALWLGTLGESLEIRGDATILIMPDRGLPALAPEGYSQKPVLGEPRKPRRMFMRPSSGSASVARQLAKRQVFHHPLIEAVHLAFSEHRPLALSPDSIWLTIVQGFGHHVHENAEALRGRIVGHEGKKELSVETRSLEPSRWPELISQLSGKIKENSDPVLHETLLCDFTTTTPAVRTACEVALMDTYQRYFDYGMRCICGIPKVTLEGTPEDWQRMRDRIEVLATYDLDWWTSRLAPILDQFIATATGNPDRAFWQAIYKPQKFYAMEMATGWIADLFPYLFSAPPRQAGDVSPDARGRGLRDSPAQRRNLMLNAERVNWLPAALPAAHGAPARFVGVNLKSFPSGLSRAPVKIEFPGGSKQKVFLTAGFLGVSQSPEDNTLSPIISWAVVQ
ncbi:MAG: DUF4419 domain-containing protein [Candidatus Sulfotelmatobacter sp.]